MKLIDSHCHLGKEFYKEDLISVIKEVKEKLDLVINVGCGLSSSQESISLAKKYSFIYATVGIHPNSANEYNSEVEKSLIDMIKEEKVVGIGESGLDYYRDIVPVDIQKKSFEKHLWLCKDFNKPIVIHGREAYGDIVNILNEDRYNSIAGVFHSYAGSFEEISDLLDNYYISISGIVTFPNAKGLRECVKKLPIERILVETDAPFLSPQPVRGKKNLPHYVIHTAQEIAKIKEMSLEDVISQTNRNTRELFKI